MMKSMKLGARMAAVFAVLGVMVAVMGALCVWQIGVLRTHTAQIKELMTVRVMLAQWQGNTAANAARTVAALQSHDLNLSEKLAGAMKEVSARISELQKQIEATHLTEADRRGLATIAEARKNYIAARDETLKLKKAGDAAAEHAFAARFTPAHKAYEAAMHGFIDGYSKSRLEEQAAAEAASAHTLNLLGFLGLALVVLASAMVYLLTRSITRPLARAVDLADRVAKGDLTGDIQARSRDEVGQLSAALKRMNDNLKGIVAGVRASTDAIFTASGEIASGNADLSQRTEEQASSLEETASSMEEMTSTVKQNADNAKQANALALEASRIATEGGRAVGEVVARMAAISDSSKKIGDIIGVIDGIAFQTNILALNAAVEAARAGEQGRGFAVVATEVRTLAQRSAAAAKEIKQLISDSVGEVEDGTRLVSEAGRTIEGVVQSVERVSAMVAEISTANAEQDGGIEQMNAAIMQMDNVTQQNAALVEEAAAAAESMREQAQRLSDAVSVFKLPPGADAEACAVGSKRGAQPREAALAKAA